jgi:sRNA-binding regulator protein Hfq
VRNLTLQQKFIPEGVVIVNRKLFRPTLTEMKEPHPNPSRAHSTSSGPQPHKKPAPPEQTHAENFYWIKQMQARTPVVIILSDGESLHGIVEWYDRDCIKLTRTGSPNLLIYKQFIKYIYKDGPEAALGGTNGQ